MGRVTRITIDIRHDRLNSEWNKDVDMHVGERNLEIYGSYAWHLVQGAVGNRLADARVEVVQE